MDFGRINHDHEFVLRIKTDERIAEIFDVLTFLLILKKCHVKAIGQIVDLVI